MSQFPVTLPGIKRTLDKIEAALSRKVISLESIFREVDPKQCQLISDTKFFTVVYNQLGHEFGVCQEEVRELADYFKKPDGRVCYQEMLNLVSPNDIPCKPYVSGLEWEDDEHINVLPPFELRQLELILTKIAHLCRLREVFLEGFFKDYEKSSCNNGTVTVGHFRRILNFAGITLGAKEFQILSKRFLKHGYSINYFSFVKEIQNIIQWMDKHGFPKKCLDDFPEKIIVVKVDKLPRPEIRDLDVASKFHRQKASHPSVEHRKNVDVNFEQLMLRIKKHVLDNRIRTRQFFEKFDKFKRGFITKSQYFRSLDSIGVSGLHRLYVAPNDLEKIFSEYCDSAEDQFGWCSFCDDLDEVFTIKNIDKQPYRVVQSPPEEIKELQFNHGNSDWDKVPKSIKLLAQEALLRIRNIIKSRRISIEPFFKDHDKLNRFHVSRNQMRRVFSGNSILISEQEVEALMLRYGDDMGFNYWKFQQEIADVPFCEAKHQEIINVLKKIKEQTASTCLKPSVSIVEVLAKVINQVTRNRINIDQFLRNGEILNSGIVPKSKFRAAFGSAGITLENCELDILCNICQHPLERDLVDYKKLSEVINKAFLQTNLEKNPSYVPVQYIPADDDSTNFLSFEERSTVSYALQKLSRFHDDVSNMKSYFEDRGGENGIIGKDKLVQVFEMCGLMELITMTELNILFKCFSKSSGMTFKFDYENFLMVLVLIREM